jgi:hypothetical protein
MYACQQSRDQDVRRILAKKVAQLPHQVHIFWGGGRGEDGGFKIVSNDFIKIFNESVNTAKD